MVPRNGSGIGPGVDTCSVPYGLAHVVFGVRNVITVRSFESKRAAMPILQRLVPTCPTSGRLVMVPPGSTEGQS